MDFHKISLQDKEWMNKRLREEQPECCEYTFVSNFLWRKTYNVEVAEYEGCGVIRYFKNGKFMYSFPFGRGDKKTVIEKMMEVCRKSGYPLVMYPITEKYREFLIENFSGIFLIKSDRDNFDYVYSREKLACLKGKKYHGKRNHIARFKDSDDWEYEPITEENIEECRKMHREWLTINQDKWDSGISDETEAVHEAFDYYKKFNLVGGLVKKGGQIAAFAIGEPLNDNEMVVHFEKAYPDMQGAYPMINQQFVLNECEGYEYVNREEDTGDEGLRKAKLSYYPEILLKKYTASESEITFADKNDFDDIRSIWKLCFADKEDYINLYIKNRFDNENMMVIRKEGKVVSMASFLPAEIKNGEDMIPVRYVYAVATLPEYQKKGYASKIIQYAYEVFGETLVLQPADGELKAYYEKLGFKNFFENKSFEFSDTIRGSLADKANEFLADSGVISLEKTDAQEYKKIRDKHFDRDGYLNWDEDAIKYALLENEFCGGEAVKVFDDILLYRIENGSVRIIETSLKGGNLYNVVDFLMKENGCIRAYYNNEGGMVLFNGEGNLSGKNDGYLNLTLG